MVYEYDDDSYPEDRHPDPEPGYEEDLAAANAVEDAKYDAMMPEQEEPDDWRQGELTHRQEAEDLLDGLRTVEFGSAESLKALGLLQANSLLAVAEELAELRAVLTPRPAPPVDPWAEGAKSPTDPAALGAWLRALSFGTVLRERRGGAWQRALGAAGDPVLCCTTGDAMELTEGDPDLETLALSAPFTVLDPGAPF